MLEHLAHQRTQFGLVLDDLHHLNNAAAQAEVARIVAALPAGCTVAVGSRDELPIAMRTAAGARGVHAVSEADLRFDVAEIQSLVGGDRKRATLLHAATGGWPAAVTALDRSGADIPNAPPDGLEQYIETEVLAQLPEWVDRFVLEVAHLDAFTIDLCEAVSGRDDIVAALGWLRDRGLFLDDIGANEAGGWARLQPMVAAVARHRAASRLNAHRLWTRASEWHHAHGRDDDALHYALLAHNRALVTALSGDVLIDAALRGEAVRCVQWLRRLVPADLASDSRAHGIAVYLAVEWMDVDEREPWLRSRERDFGGDDDAVWTLVNAIAAMRDGRSSQSIELSERVVHRCLEGSWPDVGEFNTLLLGSAFSNLLRARVLQGDMEPNDPLFGSAISLIRPRSPLLASWVNSFWGLVAFAAGDYELAAAQADAFYQVRRLKELGRPVRADNAPLGAAVAATRTQDPVELKRLADGLEDVPRLLETKGQYTEATLARLVASGLYRRAGLDAQADAHGRRAEAMLATFPDARFLVRIRDRMAALPGTNGAAGPVAPADLLTPQQRVVANYLKTDLTLDEIASRMFISRHTLRTHIRNIYRRLGAHSRVEVATGFHD